MTAVVATNQTIIVVGGGISGMTAALEAAETGKQVILLEKRPYLGGRVTQLYKYFPKMCHPTCGQEINQRRIKMNKNLTVITQAEVSNISGGKGDYTVSVTLTPRYVNSNCTACGDCAKAATTEFDDEFNYNLGKRKGVYLPNAMAFPQQYVIDARLIGTPEADAAKAACKYGAIDLDEKEETIELKAGAVVFATGWKPYDANKIQPYGYDRFANVINNVEFERLMDPHGPTGGKLLRPSDGKEAKNIAFIQCAGSRDRNYLKHCSRFCCMASLKQTQYVTEKYGTDGKSTIYYIDIRSIDRFEDFYRNVQADPSVSFIKSKVAKVEQDKDGNPVLHGVNTEGYHRYANTHDLVVLATGMEPSVDFKGLPIKIAVNEEGFIEHDEANGGIFAAGVAADAMDVNRAVQHATAAALRAVQVVNQVAGA
ncbi:MAG TPA: CoB--CoM heterodisulfide reductase iron-sulfur subunit A family protein [Candidatus Thiothrix moscowensis]|uniref:CoB--CoM heterodisulfide reductase iron-sulfur subunit A family protein n=1 Tax=unclassified Thiothrix TaxID=2636184 RepID=UPI0025FC2DEF|nr:MULTISPECIES: CoB--CoM heterodisulfide reductase iron-sulfur subunit A family protein [unclassified Thiothrix]HRJ51815.1 CoB--CoM heterodisulfide reductase iron-sulfur subunit A family protein [Candidatus Thiothrix moscowensis]HRJ92130.1 CoB--CoM heterodisulfide reductase iron-sulfur subunit A family protein [Candidatus Thiothrix moscowensis]